VLAAALHDLLALLPHGARKPHPPPTGEAERLWYFIEDHGVIVFPLLGLAIAALLYFGIRLAMKSSTAELQKKQDRKDAIVRMMRSKLLVSADVVAGDLRIDKFLAAALLEELVREGKLIEQRKTGGITNYRLKGL
jgi:hypothetical protein